MLFLLAWRNIWRNKRRTLITSGSVFFAIILAVFMRSATDGVYEGMIQNVVSFSSGYIQIHQKGYWNERSIENAMKVDIGFLSELEKEKDIIHCTPRLESFALASSKQKTKGIALLGIHPGKEKSAARLNERVISGSYFRSDSDPGILLSAGLAAYFELKPGDTLVLISQGYHATSAAALFPIRGIVSLGSPQLNNNLIYLSLPEAQNFLSADSLCTSVSLYLRKDANLNQISAALKNHYASAQYEVMTWKEMMPEIDQFIVADRSGHLIMIGILYLVISFGIYGTVSMMIFERRLEFGILISIGMKKHLLMFLVILETLFVTFFGALIGMLASFCVILYFVFNPIYFGGEIKEVYERFGIEPIINMALRADIFYYQALIVFLLALFISIYPGMKILKLKPIDAMRS